MNRHPLDVISAALGLLAVTAGVLVMAGAVDRLDTDPGWWLAAAALLAGLVLVPWSPSARGGGQRTSTAHRTPGERASRASAVTSGQASTSASAT